MFRMQKINHHYIPQFHLRNFSSNGKSISMFINKKRLFIKNASIKEQAYKKHLYGTNDDIENWLMEIEDKIANITRKILVTFKLPPKSSEEYKNLLLYLLLAEARVQKIAESQNNFIDKFMKMLYKMEKNHDLPSGSLDNIKLSYNIPNQLVLKAAAQMYPILFDLRMILLISDCDRRFITTDNPLTRYNQFFVHRNYTIKGYGLGNMGIQLFYPISPKICLCLYDDVLYHCNGLHNECLRLVKGKDVDELNKLFYLNSMDYLFFSDQISETYIRRISDGLTPVHNLENEINIYGSEKDRLVHHQVSFVKVKIRLPNMIIGPGFLAMPLPAHMAGPMRPYAQRFSEIQDGV